MRTLFLIALAYCVAARVLELLVSRRNTARVLARGGRVVPDPSTPWLLAVHASWFAALVAEELLRGASLQHTATQSICAGLFIFAECTRYACMHALGDRWSVRIVVLPGEALVSRGPYRYAKHPNYVASVLMIVALPLALGLPITALLILPLKLMAIHARIGLENRALLEA